MLSRLTARSSRAMPPYVQALDGLAGDVGNHIEVLVEMQDGEAGKFCGRRDDQVRYGRCPMLASVGEQGQNLDRSVLDSRGHVLNRHRGERRVSKSGAQIWA